MDRFTKRGFDPELEFCAECDYHGEPNGCNRARGNCSAYAVFTDAYVRLAAYEDTGLTPDDVAALRAENERLCAALKEAAFRRVAEAVKDLPPPNPHQRGYRIIAVDFDGCLCENAWPEIGKPNVELIERLKASQMWGGDKLILWTCREGESLAKAVEWCKIQGLEFDAVNENLPEMIEVYGNDCRKIGADLYIDDKAMNVRA